MSVYVHQMPTRVVGGVGSLERLADEVAKYNRKCLVVTGRRSSKISGILNRIQGLLSSVRIEATIFDQVEPNPNIQTIQDGVALARSSKARWILAVGGGSSLDAAKAIALMAVNQEDIRSYFKGLRPENKPFPVVAIPTTSGTGSEVTPYAIITDVQKGDKFGIGMPELFPQLAILDPKLTVSMPENITVDTGLDALCHAIEAFFALRRSPITDTLAADAVKRILRNLPLARQEPEDIRVRTELQVAAMLAGLAIADTGTLVPHALGYPVTVRYGISHGRATVLLMPIFLERMQQIEPERAAQVGVWFQTPHEAYAGLKNFVESLGVAPCLSAYGMTEKDVTPFSDLAKGKKHLSNSPGEWNDAALQGLYRRSL